MFMTDDLRFILYIYNEYYITFMLVYINFISLFVKAYCTQSTDLGKPIFLSFSVFNFSLREYIYFFRGLSYINLNTYLHLHITYKIKGKIIFEY